MHTSTALKSSDFEFRKSISGAMTRAPFEEFCPEYHELDRTGVVCPVLEDGVLHTGIALLAQTTAFYDIQRSKSEDFFIYPQHFAIMDFPADGVNTRSGRLDVDLDATGPPWGNLDVWPSCKWIRAGEGVVAALQAVFDLQINRLYWPDSFSHNRAPSATLPEYARKMLANSMKSVLLYGSDTMDIEVSSTAAQEILEESASKLEKLSEAKIALSSKNDLAVNRFESLSIESFLDRLGTCFDS